MQEKIVPIVIAIALAFLLSLYIAASMFFNWFPSETFTTAFRALSAVVHQYRQNTSEINDFAVFPIKHEKSGVITYKAGQALEGKTLYSSAEKQSAFLINMDGSVAHEWNLPYREMWEETDDVQNLVPDRFIMVRKVRMLPNGDLIVIYSSWGATPYGYGIAKVDKNSKLLWKNFTFHHHSFDIGEDGNIYTLDHPLQKDAPERFKGLGTPYLDDGVKIYSPDGQLIQRFSILDAIYNSSLKMIWPVVSLDNRINRGGDVLHSNDIDVLSADIADKFPMAKAGDLLISFRHLNAICIIDPNTEKVIWFTTGYWHQQHDSDFLSNGNMLLFDNQYLNAEGVGSRVVEFNPSTMEIVWQYIGNQAEPFFSEYRASQERLSNGNTLITESNSSRIFEVTADGEIVWDFYNPARTVLKDGTEMIPGVFWGKRYEPEYIQFKTNGPVTD